MEIRPIQTEDDYEAALEEIARLVGDNPGTRKPRMRLSGCTGYVGTGLRGTTPSGTTAGSDRGYQEVALLRMLIKDLE